MQNIREAASNTAASAKAGWDKTKATAQEKVERMSTQDPVQKEMATENKEMRKAEAEANKQYARDHNAASRMAGQAGSHPQYTTGGDTFSGSQQTYGMSGQGTDPFEAGDYPKYGGSGGDAYGYSATGGQGVDPFQGGGGLMDSGTGIPGDNTGYNTRARSGDRDEVTGADVPPTRFNYR